MRNIRLTIAYDGTDFHGWQRQPHARTIQSCLEEVLEKLLGEPAGVVASGRTDAGVHALNQVANFRTSNPIPCPNLVKAVNDLLPPAVRVREAQEAPDGFHARYLARSKTYRYRILQAPLCSPFAARYVYHYPYPLDRSRMARAAGLIEGRHDFASFAGSLPGAVREPRLRLRPSSEREGDGETTESPELDWRLAHSDLCSTVRTILRSRILWRARTSIAAYDVCGTGFLHHMVRNIVGTLIEVGRGKLEPDDMLRILEARDRKLAGSTAPAGGLCLMEVEY